MLVELCAYLHNERISQKSIAEVDPGTGCQGGAVDESGFESWQGTQHSGSGTVASHRDAPTNGVRWLCQRRSQDDNFMLTWVDKVR